MNLMMPNLEGVGEHHERGNSKKDRLLTGAEISELFRVAPKTVARWGKAGRIRLVRTPGGHFRYFESDVRELLRPCTEEVPA